MAASLSIVRNTVVAIDLDADGVADPGETLTTTIRISNTGDAMAAAVAALTEFNGVALVAGSVKVTPIAFDDGFSITGNTPVTLSFAQLLGNDVDPDGAQAGLVISNISAGTNGTVSVDYAAKTLTFNPATGLDVGQTATLSYTITDAQGLASVSTGTVTFTIADVVWYVDSSYAGANGAADGSYLKPFTSLSALNDDGTATAGQPGTADGIVGDDDVDGAGETIFVYDRGTSAYATGIALEANQKLYGDSHALTVNGLAIGASASNTTINHAGAGITLASGNTVSGFDIVGTANGAIGLQDGGGTVGTLTVTGTNIRGSGQAVDIDQGGAINITLGELSSANSTAQGVQLSGAAGTALTGSFSATSGTISGATGSGFLIGSSGGTVASAGGNATISYAGAITNAGGSSVEVQDRTGGTVTFSGNITDTTAGSAAGILVDGSTGTISFTGATIALTTSSGAGVSLVNNTGATINFTPAGGGNGLDIVTATGTGFNATGGGTVNLTGTGNTINSTSGTALNVANTTIGASGLTFRSISAGNNDANADPVNGIVLNNTGSSGGLTVTGANSVASEIRDSSGGTIQHTSGAGIVLTNTRDVSFNNMTIQTTGGSGVDGTGVVNFSHTNGAIDRSGLTDSLAQTQDSNTAKLTANLAFNDSSVITADPTLPPAVTNNISGNVVVTNNLLSRAAGSNVDIFNTTGTISNLNISKNTFTTANSTVEGAALTSVGGAITIIENAASGTGSSVLKANIDYNKAIGLFAGPIIQFNAGAVTAGSVPGTFGVLGSATNVISISNNEVGGLSSTQRSNTEGITFNVRSDSTSQRGQANVILDHNSVSFVKGRGLVATMDGSVDATSIVQNNVLNTFNTFASAGMEIGADSVGNVNLGANYTALVQNNTVTNNDGSGIYVIARASTSTLTAKVLNNTVSASMSGVRAGIRVDSGSTNGDTTVNLEISGNTSAGSGGTNGIGLRKQGTNPSVNTFNIEGLSPSPNTDGNQVVNHVNSLNPNGNGTLLISATTGFTAAVVPLLVAPEDSSAQGGPATSEAIPNVGEAIAGTFPPQANGDGQPTGSSAPPAGDSQGAAESAADDGVLAQAELNTLVDAAIERWIVAGATPEQVAAMRGVVFSITDMTGVYLGQSAPGAIQLDSDGGGHGWFVDASPLEDGEFTGGMATADGGAQGRVDLLTVILHELGHQIGLDDSYALGDAGELMYGYLTPGVRRLPAVGEAEGAEPAHGDHQAYALTALATIGSLPAGKSVEVIYQSTVNSFSNQVIPAYTNTSSATATGIPSATTAAETLTIDSLTLGNLIYRDVNANGVYNAGTDVGVSGVALTLFADTNGNGSFDAGTDVQLATTTSGAGGAYSFANLAPGSYIVRVDAANFTGGGALAGQQTTSGGTDPDDNVDGDDNGVTLGTAVVSQAITLAYNSEPTAGTGNDANLTLDLGFVPVNAAPAATGLAGDTAAFVEDGAAVRLDVGGNATITDATSATFAGGQLTVAITANKAAGEDVLGIATAGTTVTLSNGTSVGSTVSVGGTAIGTIAAAGTGAAGDNLIVMLSAGATPATITTLVRALTYANTNTATPSTAARSIAVTLVDGGGTVFGGTDTLTVATSVTVSAVDDAATAGNDSAATDEATAVTGSVFGNDADVDGPALSVAEVNGQSANVGVELTLASGAKVKLNADGSYRYDPNGAFDSLVSASTASATGAANGSATDSFTYRLATGNTATVTVSIAGLTSAGDRLKGDAGNNVITGTTGNDFFEMGQGGDDQLSGGEGDDGFLFYADFDGNDRIDGGAGTNDQLGIKGAYAGTVSFDPAKITGIEVYVVLPGFDYAIAVTNPVAGLANILSVHAGQLLAGDDFTFTGTGPGAFKVFGGLGKDTLTGGSGDDGFYFGPAKFTAADTVDGGAGTNDQLGIDGDYTLTLGGNISNIEVLVLYRGVDGDLNDYVITTGNGFVGAGETKTIWGINVETAMTINGAGELDGNLTIYGGKAADTLTGGNGNDWFLGGAGGDTITVGGGADTVAYDAPAESTGTGFDRLVGFDFAVDRIDLPTAVGGFAAIVGQGRLDLASFDADLAAALAGTLGVGQAVAFTPDSGSLAGRTFAVVDANGTAGYQQGGDYVIELVTPVQPPSTGVAFIV